MPGGPVSVTKVAELSAAQFGEVDEIYVQVFPPEERRPLGVALERSSMVWLAVDAGKVVGFALAVELRKSNAALLQYIGVHPWIQSRGIGAGMLHEMSRELKAQGLDSVYLEVEDPGVLGANSQAERRLSFYRRWGAARPTCLRRYFMPDFTDPENRLPMQLLWRPLGQTLEPAGAALRTVLTDIFESDYADVRDIGYLRDLLREVVC